MQQGYYSAAWSDIKNSPGWFGKVCLLGLLGFIPVFGSMVCYGYSYAWARDIAWNVHQPMPARLLGNEDGKLYSRGIFAWLLFFIAGAISTLLTLAIGDSSLGLLVVTVVSVFLGIFVSIGVMRIAIYGRFSAGVQLKKMWSMMAHDINGLLRIVGMVVLISLIIGLIIGAVVSLTIFIMIGLGMLSAGAGAALMLSDPSYFYGDGMYALAPVMGVGLVILAALAYVASCASCWLNLLQARAMGYWTRQFDVASWRGQDDPMPFEAADAAAKAAAAAAAAAAMERQQAAAPDQQASQPQEPSWPAPFESKPAVTDPFPPLSASGDASQQADSPNAAEAPAEGAAPQGDAAAPAEDAGEPLPSASAEPVAAAEPAAGDAASEAVVLCPSCGAKSPDPKSKFCVFCGTKLSE